MRNFSWRWTTKVNKQEADWADGAAKSKSRCPPLFAIIFFVFSVLTASTLRAQNQATSELDQTLNKIFDSTNLALRANAVATGGGSGSPSSFLGADQIFNKTYDSTNNALKINCVAGCTSGAGGGVGTVTSVGLALPSVFTVSGSPVTSSGTLTGTWASQSANLVLASPNGASGTPVFRSLVDADLTPSYSGVGSCPSNQWVTGLTRNGAPTCIQPGFTSISGSIGSSQLPGATASALGAIQLTGDLGGSASSPKVSGLQGVTVSSTAPSSGQCLTYSGSNWTPGSCGSSGGGLPSSWTTNSTTNAVTAQPTAGQDATPLTLAPNVTSPTADILDVCSTIPCSSGTKYFGVTANGNLTFSGNSATYQGTGQAHLNLYGGASPNAPAYFELFDSTGTYKSTLFDSVTLNGVVGVGNAVPGGDISAPSGDVCATGPCIVVANSATGTTTNLLAALTGSGTSPTATTATTSQTAVPVYPVVTGGGTSGNVALATGGVALCTFDGATTINHFVQASTTVAGDCHDAGASAPTSGWVIGQVMSTNGSGGTYNLQVGPPGYNAASGGGGAATSFQFGSTNQLLGSTAPTNGQVLAWNSGTSTWGGETVSGTGTVTSIGTSAPLSGGPITTSGTITCTTCATTTNGGALSGTAPVAISAGGAISITGSAGGVLAGSGPAFTPTPTHGVQGTTQGGVTLAGASGNNAVTILGSTPPDITIEEDGLTTQTDALYLKNTTAAVSGTQELSPAIHQEGQGWVVLTAPTAPTSGTPTSGGSCTAGTHVWAITFINAFGETTIGTSSSSQTCSSSYGTEGLSAIPKGPTGTLYRNVYQSKAGYSTPLYLDCASSPCIGDNSTTTYSATLADGSLGAQSPSTNTTGNSQAVDFGVHVVPVQGTTANSSYWNFWSVINGAAPSTRLTLGVAPLGGFNGLQVSDSINATLFSVGTSDAAYFGYSGSSGTLIERYDAPFIYQGYTARSAAGDLLDITGGWNNSLHVFGGINLNVTGTAYAAGSNLLNLQLSGNNLYTFGANGAAQYGLPGSQAGTLALCPATGSYCTTLGATASTASGTVFNFPTGNGSNGNILQTDGNGNTSWAAAGGGGGSGTVNSGTAGQMAYYATSTNAVNGNANATISSGALTLGQSGTAGSLILNGSTSGTATLSASATGGTLNLGSTNATVTSAGALTVASCTGCGGSGGSPAFSSITSGTNTSAAMLVGAGASLGPTGTGTVTASGVVSSAGNQPSTDGLIGQDSATHTYHFGVNGNSWPLCLPVDFSCLTSIENWMGPASAGPGVGNWSWSKVSFGSNAASPGFTSVAAAPDYAYAIGKTTAGSGDGLGISAGNAGQVMNWDSPGSGVYWLYRMRFAEPCATTSGGNCGSSTDYSNGMSFYAGLGIGVQVTSCASGARCIGVGVDTSASDASGWYFITSNTSARTAYHALNSSGGAVSLDSNFHSLTVAYMNVSTELWFELDAGDWVCFTSASSGGCTGSGPGGVSAYHVVNSANLPGSVASGMYPFIMNISQGSGAVQWYLGRVAFNIRGLSSQ